MINRVTTIQDKIPIKNCIISVADKTDCADFAASLLRIVPELTIYSTGGTYALIENSLSPEIRKRLVNIEDFTGQPEMQGGLVKTLDFKIYTGILSEPGNQDHLRHIENINGTAFDMVVVNLYPFQKAVADDDCTVEDARSHIDIGGPCMLRAGAKNFLRVASVCDPSDYTPLIAEMQKNEGSLCAGTRLMLAKKAFSHTAEYDSAIETYMQLLNTDILGKVYSIGEGSAQ